MGRHVASYTCEWKGVLEDPDKLSRFVSFVNAPDTIDSTVAFTEYNGRKRPAASNDGGRTDPVPIGMPHVRA
jgi:nitrite reductase (NADH) large subunit